jgi:HD superfamily phosphohydrolase
LGKDWLKLFADPVHRIIGFEDSPCDRLLLDLVNTKEFQRLRRIKQLGVSEQVFPGASHTRFCHSLGVLHTARMFIKRVQQLTEKLTDDQKTRVLVAALLHDVGHGPFSHVFEKVTGESHEKRTLEIIRDDHTDVHRRLVEFDKNLPEDLAIFFDEDVDEDSRIDSSLPVFLTQIVHSQLDADRFDYLLRDSLSTGTDYGNFDIGWLIQHLFIDEERRRFYLSRKAIMSAESYVFARYHMYRTVYFHKTTRAAEVMLRLLFRRFKDLLDNSEEKANIVQGAPSSIAKAFSGGMSLEDYLQLDDHTITEFLKACLNASDSILSELARGLLYRRLFKGTDVTNQAASDIVRFTEGAKEAIKSAGRDPAYYFADDSAGDTPYKPYHPDSDEPNTQIYVDKTTELSDLSDPVDELRKKYILLRYYYPEDVRMKVEEVAAKTLKGAI